MRRDSLAILFASVCLALLIGREVTAAIPHSTRVVSETFTLNTAAKELTPSTGEAYSSILCVSDDTAVAVIAGDSGIVAGGDGLTYSASSALGAVISKNVASLYAYVASGTQTIDCEFAVESN